MALAKRALGPHSSCPYSWAILQACLLPLPLLSVLVFLCVCVCVRVCVRARACVCDVRVCKGSTTAVQSRCCKTHSTRLWQAASRLRLTGLLGLCLPWVDRHRHMVSGMSGDTQALLFRLRALVPAHTRTIGAHIHMATDAHAHMGHTHAATW